MYIILLIKKYDVTVFRDSDTPGAVYFFDTIEEAKSICSMLAVKTLIVDIKKEES